MDIPGLTSLLAKVQTECGIISALLVIVSAWLAYQLAKTRADWEKDRASSLKVLESDRTQMMKIIQDTNEAYDSLAVSHNRLEAMLIAFQASRTGGDD